MKTRPGEPRSIGSRIASMALMLALIVPLVAACVPTATAPTVAPAKPAAEATKPAESKPAAAATTAPAAKTDAKPAESPAAAKPAEKPAAAAKPVDTSSIPSMTLKIADTFPPTGFVPETRKWWADEITKRTDGKVQFQFFWSDSLFKQADAATNLNAGVADIANVASTYDPSKTALWMTLDMPFNAKDYWCGMSAGYDVNEAEPNLKRSFEELGFRPVMSYSSGQFHFLAKNPILKLSDLQGKRVRSYGGARVKMYETIGLAPIFMPYAQIYEALERGVIDGAEATLLLTESFKHYEIAKNLTIANSGFVIAAPLSISTKTWDRFPDNLKQVFNDVAREYNIMFARRMMELEEAALTKFQQQYGMTIHKLSAEDQAALEKAGKDAQDKWLVEMDSKGVPARATWTKFRELYDTCEKDVAAKGYPWKQ